MLFYSLLLIRTKSDEIQDNEELQVKIELLEQRESSLERMKIGKTA